MLTIDAILKELKNVPASRLEELYSIILSLRADSKKQGDRSGQILSFAGSFSDMPEDDYNDFLQQAAKTRDNLFDRDSNI